MCHTIISPAPTSAVAKNFRSGTAGLRLCWSMPRGQTEHAEIYSRRRSVAIVAAGSGSGS
ncbi:MAG: hypothetical protein ACI91B_001577, partial [Planctomycetota bacterium]